jgi:hypothetical protein
MPYRINHIHLEAPDPRKTAEWYVTAFNFKIMSDEVRAFGDRFMRWQSEDGGMAVKGPDDTRIELVQAPGKVDNC